MSEPAIKSPTIIRRGQVESRTGLSCSGIYKKVKNGSFPPPVCLGSRKAVGWVESEVDAWISEQIAASRNAA